MPWTLRLALLPFAVLLELVMLALGWVLALASPRQAEAILALAKRLPAAGWYLRR